MNLCRCYLSTAMLAVGLATFAGTARAEDYPSRIITIIVPQAPGGGNDTIARILAEKMSRSLDRQVIVENRPGAGGTIGTRHVAQSAPDGYTLAIGSTGTLTMAPTAIDQAGYDPRKDFAPVGMIAKSAIVLVVGPSVTAKTVKEMIEQAKAEPQKFTYGSGGVGSANHFTGVMFGRDAKIKLTHVPFKGASPALTDVMGGHVSMIFSSLPPALGNVKAGNLRVLATCATERSSLIPDVPTMDEAGLKGFEAEQRYGLIAPAGTPAPIIAKLNKALREALADRDVQEKIAADGAVTTPSSPEEYAKDIDREETKWSAVVREAASPK